jgi:Restriction endonuclease
MSSGGGTLLSSTSARLLDRLRELPFNAFTQVAAMLLERLGYHDIQPAGRTDWKGRNRQGGVDLTATYRSATGERSIAFQLKQFHPKLRIFQRTVDELRGVCLRQGASEGMLITTSGYSPTITGTHDALAPLYLMGGEELALLLRQYRIGVTKQDKLDEDFFKRLERESRGKRPQVSVGPKPSHVHTNQPHASHVRDGEPDQVQHGQPQPGIETRQSRVHCGDLVVTVSFRQNRSLLRLGQRPDLLRRPAKRQAPSDQPF